VVVEGIVDRRRGDRDKLDETENRNRDNLLRACGVCRGSRWVRGAVGHERNGPNASCAEEEKTHTTTTTKEHSVTTRTTQWWQKRSAKSWEKQ
jgi:hypothetical protein